GRPAPASRARSGSLGLRGGAPPALRRDDAREATPRAHVRAPPQPLRSDGGERPVPLPRRAAEGRLRGLIRRSQRAPRPPARPLLSRSGRRGAPCRKAGSLSKEN